MASKRTFEQFFKEALELTEENHKNLLRCFSESETPEDKEWFKKYSSQLNKVYNKDAELYFTRTNKIFSEITLLDFLVENPIFKKEHLRMYKT
jgi:hypothetical protein